MCTVGVDHRRRPFHTTYAIRAQDTLDFFAQPFPRPAIVLYVYVPTTPAHHALTVFIFYRYDTSPRPELIQFELVLGAEKCTYASSSPILCRSAHSRTSTSETPPPVLPVSRGPLQGHVEGVPRYPVSVGILLLSPNGFFFPFFFFLSHVHLYAIRFYCTQSRSISLSGTVGNMRRVQLCCTYAYLRAMLPLVRTLFVLRNTRSTYTGVLCSSPRILPFVERVRGM